MKKLFKKRQKASKSFKRLCKMGLYINLIFLCIFLGSVAYLGFPAFKQTYIFVEANRNSPSYDLLSRAEQRKIRTGQIAEKSWLLANSEVDQYMKQKYNRLSEKQRTLVDDLVQKGEIELKFNSNFFLNGDSKSPENSGILSSVIGTLLVMLVCMVVSVPIGVAAAIYLEEFAPQNILTHFIEVCINNLASIPSILFGLLGLGVFINLFGMPRSSALVGGLTLAIMSLPIIIVSTKAALTKCGYQYEKCCLCLRYDKGSNGKRYYVTFGYAYDFNRFYFDFSRGYRRDCTFDDYRYDSIYP